jgi:hypothetical protein
MDITSGHFNSDNIADVALVSYLGGLHILLGSAQGTLSPLNTFAAGSGPVSLTVNDFNGDGKEDIAVSNLYNSKLTLHAGLGNGSFAPRLMYDIAKSPDHISSGDVNADNLPDVIVETDDLTFVYNNGASAISVTSSSNNVCPGTTVNLIATGGIGYSWNTGANTSSIVVTPDSTSVFTFTTFNANACGGARSITINVLPGVPVSVSAATSYMCLNDGTITLSGLPPGGSYSGSGVSGNGFAPLSVGDNVIHYAYTYTNNCVLTATTSVFADPCTGLGRQSERELLVLYPNPAVSSATIDLPYPAEIIVYNAIGNKMDRLIAPEGQTVINTTNWPSGIYSVKINSEKKEQVIKLIKNE